MAQKKTDQPASEPTQDKTPVFIEADMGTLAESTKGAAPEALRHSKRRQRKKKTEKPLEALKNIYQTEGVMPDLSKIERRRRSPRALLVGLIVFFAVLAGAAWAGFFIFKPYARFEGKGMELSIVGPASVKAGEVVRYEFKYRNTERVGLAALELRLIIPKEFKVLEYVEPPTTEPTTWTLGSLGRNVGDAIIVRGYFLGPGEGTTAFQSIATYRPANFNADFQAIKTKQVVLAGTILEATVAGPPEIAPGEEGEYVYTLKNTGSEQLAGLDLALEAPTSFLFKTSEPAPTDERGKRWEIATLDPGAETTLKIRGSFAATASGTLELVVSVGVRQADDRLVHRRDSFTTDVLASDLSLEVVVNGSRESFSADFGDALHLTLAYKNLGEHAFGDVRLSVTLTADPGGLVNWEDVEMSAPARIQSGILTWTARELTDLATVAPGAEGTIDVTLPIIATAPAATGRDELHISGSALISTIGGRVAARQVQTTPILVSLNSNLAFGAEARYFDPDSAPLGSGPLPPKVGETTNLRVLWHITNTRHELEGISVRTTLPARVAWTGRSNTDLGTIRWDAGSRTVTLVIDRLGTDIGSLAADFEVAITPEAADVGKFVTLTNETTIGARDTKTGTVLSRSIDPLTSEMPTDEGARRKGAVVD